MPGELDIKTLLQTLKVVLHDSIFVFVTIPNEENMPIDIDKVQMVFREAEGQTLVLTEDAAIAGGIDTAKCTFRSRMITCDVHSSLEAVGFLAVITKALADEGIGCNPISGYYHDHLFVPAERARDAVAALEEIARAANREAVNH